MIKNTSFCAEIVFLNGSKIESGLDKSIELWQAYVLFISMGIFAAALANLFNYIRKTIFKDKDNLDNSFDAGGKVSMGLTATTIVSQWTWAATLLQSSTVASKYGISGPFWYAAGATIQILLFSMLSVQLKIRAPGAKTFLQVIKARFGSKTHIVFCAFALLTNVIVTAMLMLGGAAVMTSLVKDLSVEQATMLVATIIGIYTFIGGLGATFYVSYFNTAIIFIIMLIFLAEVYGNSNGNRLGSMSDIYKYLSCAEAPDDNYNKSHLTMISNSGFMFGIINIVGNFGTVFVDQSYWQSAVAAKPKQGVWGFLLGGITWFAVPFTFATTMGLAYTALSVQAGEPLLSEDQVDAGLVPPVVAQKLMGSNGEFMILLMILMAVTSTGSAEVVAVTSILIYDVYQLYLRPFRLVHDANSCILCGKSRGRMANPRDKCTCISMTYCNDCIKDDENRKNFKNRAMKPEYKCRTHGQFRAYNTYLIGLKDWCMLWIILAIIPLTLLLDYTTVSLGWVYLSMGVLIGSAVVPITLAMTWSRVTGIGMIAGAVSGTILAIVSWLITSSLQKGGLETFFKSTGDETSMLVGNLFGILSGGVICILVSLIDGRNRPISHTEVWENTRDIDNPLSPWTELYARDLNLTGANKLDNRPSFDEVMAKFKGARYTANIGAIVLTFLLIIIWPSSMVTQGEFDYQSFSSWVNLSISWGILAALFIIVTPVVTEVLGVVGHMKEKDCIISPLPDPEIIMETVPKKSLENISSQGIQNSSFDIGNDKGTLDMGGTVPSDLPTEVGENNEWPKNSPFSDHESYTDDDQNGAVFP